MSRPQYSDYDDDLNYWLDRTCNKCSAFLTTEQIGIEHFEVGGISLKGKIYLQWPKMRTYCKRCERMKSNE